MITTRTDKLAKYQQCGRTNGNGMWTQAMETKHWLNGTGLSYGLTHSPGLTPWPTAIHQGQAPSEPTLP